jgi:hypothetical protein
VPVLLCANGNNTSDSVGAFLEWAGALPLQERCATKPETSREKSGTAASAGCRCQGSPSRGQMPDEASWNASWQVAFARNRRMVVDASHQQRGPVDVVLLGDSITESVRSRIWFGSSRRAAMFRLDDLKC